MHLRSVIGSAGRRTSQHGFVVADLRRRSRLLHAGRIRDAVCRMRPQEERTKVSDDGRPELLATAIPIGALELILGGCDTRLSIRIHPDAALLGVL